MKLKNNKMNLIPTNICKSKKNPLSNQFYLPSQTIYIYMYTISSLSVFFILQKRRQNQL